MGQDLDHLNQRGWSEQVPFHARPGLYTTLWLDDVFDWDDSRDRMPVAHEGRQEAGHYRLGDGCTGPIEAHRWLTNRPRPSAVEGGQ